jgi:predicted small lipoprotein YifL
MYKSFLIVITLLALAACATKPVGAPAVYGPSAVSSSASRSTSDLCPYESAHVASDGTAQEGGYYCSGVAQTQRQGTGASSSSASSTPTTSGCSYVAAYIKSNGTTVGPFIRCKTYVAATAHLATLAGTGANTGAGIGTDKAPCVNAYCGPVQVQGYYRKDGTYVRPYTRRR